MGRFGDSEKDLVGALLFLLNNDAAGFITGICLPSMAASPPIRACKNTSKKLRLSYELHPHLLDSKVYCLGNGVFLYAKGNTTEKI